MSVDQDQHLAWLIFLRTVDGLRLPVVDDYMTIEQLQEAVDANGETWTVAVEERERWVRHALVRLHGGALEYGNRSLARPVVELLDEIAEEAADLGAWSVIAHHALQARDDLEPDDREVVAQALRDVAAAGAQAWARIDQAKLLLAMIDEQRPQR